jgi:hypothetical protein
MPLIQRYLAAPIGEASAFQADPFRERTPVIHNSICFSPQVDESIGDSP